MAFERLSSLTADPATANRPYRAGIRAGFFTTLRERRYSKSLASEPDTDAILTSGQRRFVRLAAVGYCRTVTTNRLQWSAPLSQQSCKVLVIDDNQDTADSAVMLLTGWGHEAVAAYSPDEAIKIGAEFGPDVVLVDIGLPGKNGFDVARELKKFCPRARFVALTGFTKADIALRSDQDGFARHLIKPVAPAALKTIVDDQCARESATVK